MPIRMRLPGVYSALLLVPALSLAIAPPEETAESSALFQAAIFSQAFTALELEAQPSLETIRNATGVGVVQAAALSRFFAERSEAWEVRWDTRSDRPNLIQGAGVPLLPGRGNALTPARVGLSTSGPEVEDVERLVRGFMAGYPELFRVAPEDLRLDPKSTVNLGPDRQIWLVELQQVHKGVPVEGANVFFRINHGNLVQLGSEKVSEVRIGTTPRVTREAAFAVVLQALGAKVSEISEVVSPGRLAIVPVLAPGERPGEPYRGIAGRGYQHALIWEIAFRRSGEPATWQAWVNARNGRILRLVDSNDYAQVTGGVYPTTNTDPETVVGLPFANVRNGTVKVTGAAGNYNYGGGGATVTLDGRYVRIRDACGAISQSDGSTGNVAFGTSTGTDCSTPGSGGAGNTHAARSGYYHLTRINRKAAGFYPGNPWLAGTLTANMNLDATCNAYWNGSTVNFYRSGGGCSNTGEIAAVFLHEWGHGMDRNAGGAATDKGSGEAVGDTFAFLETKDSCIGRNFKPGVSCYHCTDCTGVRDVAAFALGGSATIARPGTVADDGGINCDRYSCPYRARLISPYQGPMGYEGHCESYIASSANWDLAQSLVARWGATGGWRAMEEIWYGSLAPARSAYRVASGGKCNPAARVDGCASTNWYTVYLAVDDDDGNLANGTPNACRIWDAFDAHGIACGSRPACTQ